MAASITNKAKQFLSLKMVTVAILLLAIGGRIIQLIFLFNVRADRVQQMLATQNLVFGYGISTAHVFPGDLSQIIYEPLIKWPPGYSLLLAPFYILFKHNYIAAGLALDITAAITLIFVTRAILRVLETPIYLINIYTFLTSFFIYSFYIKTSSDALAIIFFLTAFYFTLLLLKTGQHWVKKSIAIIIFLFICAATKYLFIPIVFILPLFLLIKGFTDGNANIKKAGVFSFLFLAISLAGLLVYQKDVSGSATYISSTGRGFFINHLLATFPFIPASFVNLDTIRQLFLQQPGVEQLVFRIFQCVHVLFIVFILRWIILKTGSKKFKELSLADSFFYLTFFVSLTIAIILMILSVSISREVTDGGGFWTYVEEPRYYGLPNVLIHLGVFVFYQYFRSRPSRLFKNIFYILILFLLPEFFRGALFELKRLKNLGKEKYSWQVEYQVQKYAAGIIEKELQTHPTNNIVVAGSSTYMNYRVSLYSHIPILKDVYKINDLTTLNTKKDVLLLIILREDALKDFQPFISMKEKKIAGQFNIFSFYTLHVSPH